jgi:hypothetical protein
MKVLEKIKVQEACERENKEGEWARAWTSKKKKSSAFLSESFNLDSSFDPRVIIYSSHPLI